MLTNSIGGKMINSHSKVWIWRSPIVLASLCLVLGTASLDGAKPDEAKTMTVWFKSGSDSVTAFLALPHGKGPFGGMVLIHEWWGLNDWVKANAKRFADSGYVALGVDLYRGRIAETTDEAHELSRGLPEDRAVLDLKASVEYLRGRGDIKKDRIGMIGWCMGGGYSLQGALTVPHLAAAVICYGRLVTDSALIRKIACPILGIFGELDRGIPVSSVRDFEKSAKTLGKSVSAEVYADAGHAFMNENNKTGYRPDATKDAWKKIFSFFTENLKK